MTDAEFNAWVDETATTAQALEAERILSMGDVTHIIVKPDGQVSVNRGCAWADEQLGVSVDAVRDAVEQASRCKPGCRYGPEVRRIADRRALPAVCEAHRPYRWQA